MKQFSPFSLNKLLRWKYWVSSQNRKYFDTNTFYVLTVTFCRSHNPMKCFICKISHVLNCTCGKSDVKLNNERSSEIGCMSLTNWCVVLICNTKGFTYSNIMKLCATNWKKAVCVILILISRLVWCQPQTKWKKSLA